MSKKYSLWLLLQGESHGRFRAAIDGLARRFSTPPFTPHVTVYGGIRGDENAVIAQCREIARCTASAPLHIESIGMEDDRFHSLFLRVRKTPELDCIFRRAKEAFGGTKEFHPHISLLYGVIGRSEKEKALRERHEAWTGRAESRCLALYDTSGDVQEWREVAAFPMGKQLQGNGLSVVG